MGEYSLADFTWPERNAWSAAQTAICLSNSLSSEVSGLGAGAVAVGKDVSGLAAVPVPHAASSTAAQTMIIPATQRDVPPFSTGRILPYQPKAGSPWLAKTTPSE